MKTLKKSDLNRVNYQLRTFPYTDGWIFKIKLTNVSELDTLMSSEDYKKQIEE